MQCPVCKSKQMCTHKTIGVGVIVLIFVAGGYFLLRRGYQTPQEIQTPSSQAPTPKSKSSSETTVAPSEENSESLNKNVSGEPSVREIEMVSGNLFFDPKNLTMTKNQPVKITFQNTGTHTFTIDELGVNVPLRGSSAVVEFTPTKSGTFEYYCTVPGHREGGMFGSLTVE